MATHSQGVTTSQTPSSARDRIETNRTRCGGRGIGQGYRWSIGRSLRRRSRVGERRSVLKACPYRSSNLSLFAVHHVVRLHGGCNCTLQFLRLVVTGGHGRTRSVGVIFWRPIFHPEELASSAEANSGRGLPPRVPVQVTSSAVHHHEQRVVPPLVDSEPRVAGARSNDGTDAHVSL